MNKQVYLTKYFLLICFYFYSILVEAKDTVNIEGVEEMLSTGRDLIAVAARWGGVCTVVGSAIALGTGRLEGALAQTICKILIVVGLLMAAGTFVRTKIGWGFVF